LCFGHKATLTQTGDVINPSASCLYSDSRS
jgi:hypothetical protein